ncbi:TonB-dependent siderophore receptor [Marinobacter sp.]|uniref:TonB-dependent receptor plug domain-containing protein n=1 Tax=Marinobacter sp. TaxID=50741 RepID=UPI0019E4E9F1|nr:TonB-dependent receptor [Marinobacter sp.]MBE0485651.1 TonB-dependent receptor [Marinobacter sp.]
MAITNYLSANRVIKPRTHPRFGIGLLASAIVGLAAGHANAAPLADDFNPGFLALGDDIPEVLTTTRLRQPKTRVPGTTTVITGDMIRDLGIMNLYEVFRLVPGMVVNFVGSHQPVTTYHGTVHYEQRRMQVLVDGRTAHKATLSDMDWETMPVPLEMIERIEVARGPNSAAYGINAFLGTINIITRDPADSAGVETRAVRGSRGYLRTFGSVGDSGADLDWRLTYEKRKFDGFDFRASGGERPPFRSGLDINSFTYDSRLKFTDKVNLELRTGIVDGTKYNDRNKTGELNPLTDPDIDVRDYYLQSKLNISTSDRHFYHVMASVENFDRRQPYTIVSTDNTVQCLRDGTPLFKYTYFPDGSRERLCFADSGGPAAIADVNADSEDTRLELEIQDTLIINNDLKVVSGAGFRKDTFRSETYFNGRGNNYQSRFFGNLEYTPLTWLTLNAGGNWERTSTTGDDYFSPRIAANFTLNNRHALRFVYSEAVRTPDGFEQNPDWGYTLTNVSPDLYSDLEGIRITTDEAVQVQGWITLGKDLKEERITSHEISYFGQFPLQRAILSVEVRGFKDELRDMISGVIQLKDWSIDNNTAIDQKGFEVEAMLEYPGTAVRASYGYLDQHTWYTGEPIFNDDGDLDTRKQDQAVSLLTRMSVRHSGSLAVIQDLPWGLKASSAFYWADEFRRSQFERFDARIAKRLYQPRYTAELAFTMQHYLNRDPELSTDNNIKNHNQFFIEAGVRF